MKAFSKLLLLLSIFQISFGNVFIQVDYVDALDSDNPVDSAVFLDSDNSVDSDSVLDSDNPVDYEISALESDPVYDDFVEESDEIEKKVKINKRQNYICDHGQAWSSLQQAREDEGWTVSQNGNFLHLINCTACQSLSRQITVDGNFVHFFEDGTQLSKAQEEACFNKTEKEKMNMEEKEASKTIDELYPTDGEDYDNYDIPDVDYSALVEESEEMEDNYEKTFYDEEKPLEDKAKSSGECFPNSGCHPITKISLFYGPMDPYKKCLLNNQQPSLERFLCLGKFYYETEKTDQIDYSYYSYNPTGNQIYDNSDECLTVNRAVNLLSQFLSALIEVTRTKGNLLYGPNYWDNYDDEPYEFSNFSIFLVKVFTMVQEENKENNCATLAESLFSIGKAATKIFFEETVDDGTSFASLMESSIVSNVEYVKNVAKSMPDQEQEFIKDNLFKAAKWIKKLGKRLELQTVQEIMKYDQLVREYGEYDDMEENMKTENLEFEHWDDAVSCGQHNAGSCAGCPQGNGASWCNGDCQWIDDQCIKKSEEEENLSWEIDYDALLKEIDEMEKPALKQTSNSWIDQVFGFLLVLILILAILFGCIID